VSGRATPVSRRGSRGLLAALVLLVWLSRMVLPGDVAYGPLDLSWARCLGRALAGGMRCGVDWVFTFGPLGYLSTGAYFAELFDVKLFLWEGAFGLLVAVVLACAGMGIENRLLRAVWFAVVILSPLDPDAQGFLPIAAALAWTTNAETTGRTAIAISALVLAGLSLVKFTFAVAAAVAVASAVAAFLARGRTRAAVALVVAFLLLLAAGWIAAGQRLSDAPIYLARSIQLARGYSEAMSLAAPPLAFPIGFALFACAIAAAWIGAGHGPDRRARLLATLGQIAILFVVWKAGFVRARDHTPIFFLFVTAAPLLYDSAAGSERAIEKASFGARFACTAFGAGLLLVAGTPIPKVLEARTDAVHRVVEHVRALLAPESFRAVVAAATPKSEEAMDQPRTRAIVGDRPIDMIENLQMLLFRNGLSWTPRPVFQSYAAFTPKLAELNARFFEGTSAPEYVLFFLRPIDGRLATMADAAALQVVARDYEPILDEKGRLLLRRKADLARTLAEGAPRERVLEASVALGERLDLARLPGACHVLALDVRPTVVGSLANLLDAAPELSLEIGLDDGRTRKVRIVPAMMRTGVIFDPAIGNQIDWIAWVEGRKLPRPTSLRVVAPRRAWSWKQRIGVAIDRADDLVPRSHPEIAAGLAYSIFPTAPKEVRSEVDPLRRIVQGREVVTLSADADLVFDVPSGTRRFRGSFGLVGAAIPPLPRGAVAFTVVLARPGEPETELARAIVDSRDTTAGPVLHAFDATAEVASPAKLVLRSRRATDAPGDLSCWTAISVE
jgi:hypothetical protein